MKRFIASGMIVLFLMATLSSCASGPVDVPLSAIAPQEEGQLKASRGSIINSDGNFVDIGPNTTTAVVKFSDSRVASEAIISSTLKHHDTEIRKAHAASGTVIEFELVEVSPGLKIQMIKKLSSRETARFEQALPTKPSDHPGWEVAKSLGHDLILGTLVWKGLDTLGGIVKSAVTSKPSETYNGPVIMNESKNTAGGSISSGGAYSGPIKNGDEANPISETPAEEVVAP